MPNLFSNVFNEEVLKENENKSKQLAYLFEIYKKDDIIVNLLNILIENLSWTEDLEKQLNKLIEPLKLICQNGLVAKRSELEGEITFGVFINASKEISKNPEEKEKILAKHNISQKEYNEFDDALKSINKKLTPIFEKLLPKIPKLPNIPILKTSEIFETLASFTFLPTTSISTPLIYPSVEAIQPPEKVTFSGLCPLTNGSCSLSEVAVRELEGKRPYGFLIYPSKHVDLLKIVKKILSNNTIELITAIAEPFVGGKYCKICSFIKFSNFCIAEIGELNPNVLMEVGLALGLNKFTILTLNENYTKQSDVPFDLNSFMNIPYKTNEKLENELEVYVKKIKKFIDLHEN